MANEPSTTDDLITPESKTRIIGDAEKTVLKFQKLYQRGVITEQGTSAAPGRRRDPRAPEPAA